MRIAILSWESLHSVFVGGLGVHVTELAAGLERRGHEIHLITRRRPDQAGYSLIDGVHYHRVDFGGADDFVITMDNLGKAMAHRFHEITFMIGHFDLIHAHDWLTGNAMKYIMDGYGTRAIYSAHSTEYGRDGNIFYPGFAEHVRDTEAAACFHADEIIAVSGFTADEVNWIYQVPYAKMHVIHNGVSYNAFNGFVDPAAIKARYGIAPMTPTVFAAGRMTLQKGMDLLVESVPMVLGYFPEAKFIISGNGPEYNRVVAMARDIGVDHACVFLPQLSRADYIDIIRAIDVVAVPSRNEPFGIIILEAWAAGKPVVATTAGGPREFVWHNVNGFLVDANPGGLAHGIGSMLADHDHCRALGANGRRAVEDRYNWDVAAAHTEGLYQHALNKCYVS